MACAALALWMYNSPGSDALSRMCRYLECSWSHHHLAGAVCWYVAPRSSPPCNMTICFACSARQRKLLTLMLVRAGQQGSACARQQGRQQSRPLPIFQLPHLTSRQPQCASHRTAHMRTSTHRRHHMCTPSSSTQQGVVAVHPATGRVNHVDDACRRCLKLNTRQA